MQPLCPYCRDFLARNRRSVRWVLAVVLLCAFFFWVGSVSSNVSAPGFCRIYY